MLQDVLENQKKYEERLIEAESNKQASLFQHSNDVYNPYMPKDELSEKTLLDIGSSDMFDIAMDNDSIAYMSIGAIKDLANAQQFTIDENFDDKVKEEIFNELGYGDTIHPDLKDSFLEKARNKKHLEYLYEDFSKKSAYLREFEKLPWYKQFGYGAIAELTNAPIYVGAALLAPASATLLGSSALLRFTASGGAGLALEAVKDVVGDKDKTAVDYISAMVIDGGIGAVVGSNTKIASDIALEKLSGMTGIDLGKLKEMNKSMSKEELKTEVQKGYLAKSRELENADTNRILDNLVETAKRPVVKQLWDATRFDIASATKKSQSKTLSEFSDLVMPDATLQNLRKDYVDSQTLKTLIEEQMRNKYQNGFYDIANSYTEALGRSNGLFWKTSSNTEDEVSRLIGQVQLKRDLYKMQTEQAVRATMAENNVPQEAFETLMKGADFASKLAKDFHKTLGEYGHLDFVKVDGKSVIPESETYMPYSFDKGKISGLRNMGVENNDIIRTIKKGFESKIEVSLRNKYLKSGSTMEEARLKANAEIDARRDEIYSISKAFYKNITNSNINTNTGAKEVLSLIEGSLKKDNKFYDYEDLLEAIRDELDDIPAEEAGVFARKRSFIDYTATNEVVTKNGVRRLSVADMLSDDYKGLIDNYVRRMSGTTALQRIDFTPRAKKISISTAEKMFKQSKEYIAKEKELNEMYAKAGLLKEDIDYAKQLFGRVQIAIATGKTNELLRELGIDKVLGEDVSSIWKALSSLVLDSKINIDELNLDTIEKRIYEALEIEKKRRELESIVRANAEEIVEKMASPRPRKLITTRDYQEHRELIIEELNAKVEKGTITKKEADDDLLRYDTVIKEMIGVPTKKNQGDEYARAYRIIHSFNIGRLLGQTMFTMSAEMTTVMYDQGVKNMLESLGFFKTLLKSYSKGRIIDSPQLKELGEALGIYDEFLSGTKLYEFDHEFSALTGLQNRQANKTLKEKAVNAIERAGETFAEFTLMTGGVKPLTAVFSTAHALGVFKQIRNVAKGGARSSNYEKMIKELGFSEYAEKSIQKEILKHYDEATKTMNFDKWDSSLRELFLAGVKRRSDTLVQVQRMGDKLSYVGWDKDFMFKDTFFGGFALELKQFVMTAYVKQLGRAVNRQDAYMLGLISSQIAMLTLSQVVKNQINYAGNEEKLKESMTPERLSASVIGNIPAGSVLPMFGNLGSQLLVGENLFGSTRHNSLTANMTESLPAIDLINRMMGVFQTPSNMIKDGTEVKDFNDAMGLTGISNHWLTRPMVETMKAKD